MNKDDKEILFDNIHKRLQTTMIGCLARFEESFGYLWNHGDEPLTQQHYEFKDQWDALRHEILNHGNSQIRSAMSDLNKYFYHNRYAYRYKFINKGEES